MDEHAQMEALARLDGFKGPLERHELWDVGGPDAVWVDAQKSVVPDYLEDLNAVARLRGRLDLATRQQAARELWRSVEPVNQGGFPYDFDEIDLAKVLDATPRQHCEAILKSTGLWRDS